MTKEEILAAIKQFVSGQGNQAGLLGLDTILNGIVGLIGGGSEKIVAVFDLKNAGSSYAYFDSVMSSIMAYRGVDHLLQYMSEGDKAKITEAIKADKGLDCVFRFVCYKEKSHFDVPIICCESPLKSGGSYYSLLGIPVYVGEGDTSDPHDSSGKTLFFNWPTGS